MARMFERITLVLSGLIIVAMTLLMNTEVLLRYGFSTSTKISEEYSGYMFAAATMIGFYPALMRGRFLRITALVALLPLRARAVWEVVVAFASAAFCAILVWETWGQFRTSLDFGSTSDGWSATPLMYPQAILPACLALLTAAMLVRGLQLGRDLWRGDTSRLKDESDVLE
ncbi:hypothetical protein C2U72_19200 [Prosthecomicrobium hirschii]|nr:hypothetical protein C2U72_19200 [Prosthecomicrobium hirschii]